LRCIPPKPRSSTVRTAVGRGAIRTSSLTSLATAFGPVGQRTRKTPRCFAVSCPGFALRRCSPCGRQSGTAISNAAGKTLVCQVVAMEDDIAWQDFRATVVLSHRLRLGKKIDCVAVGFVGDSQDLWRRPVESLHPKAVKANFRNLAMVGTSRCREHLNMSALNSNLVPTFLGT
jgi:hypothetical protein